ncbi:lipid II flippase MurJ [Actinoplanes sp. NPDC051411]|uniref:murein biosynthesis integral membrane protein MurJ n=1 Tax=Actinoplanes sp. NPDC051411 TaxID=3155522 RepID=UPI003424BF1A
MARIAGAAALIAVLTVLARIAGLGRTLVFLYTVGDIGLANIYNAANTIPNIVFELVAGGALASLVVPLLAGPVAAGDRRRVDEVTSALLTWVLTLTVPLAVVVALAAGPISGLLQNVTPEHQELAARMLRVFAPQLPLYGIGIVLTGVLQSHHRFAWPVLAPLLSSVTVMTAYLTYAGLDGARSGFDGLTTGGEYLLSGGTTLGVVVLALCLFIPLRRLRLRLRPSYRFPGGEGRLAVRLGWAGAVTVGAQQIVIGLIVVLGAEEPLTRYGAAQTVFLLPWAVLAVPLATAVYPRLSDAWARRDERAFDTALSGTARSIMLLACLGAAGLVVLAGPGAFLIHARGAAPGIVGFAPGLLGWSMFAILSRALYARGATVAAAIATAVGWAVAAVVVVVVTTTTSGGPEVFGLGAANAAGMSVIGVLLVYAVRRKAGPGALAGLTRVTVVGIVSAGAAALAGWAAVTGAGHLLGATPTVIGSLAQGMLGGIVVVVVFATVAYPLDRRDMAPLAATLLRRIRR